MKLLMFLRDALPPGRADVAVLFDRCLREQGIQTDYVGHLERSMGSSTACQGQQFAVGSRRDPRNIWRQLKLLWQRGSACELILVRDKPVMAALLFAVAALRKQPCAYWMSFPIPLGDIEGAADHWRRRRHFRGALVWLRGHVSQWVQDKLVLPHAAHIFVQSDAMRAQVLSGSSLLSSAVSAVPMGVDFTLLQELGEQDTVRHKIEPDLVAYLGSLDRSRRLDVLIDALVLVCAVRPQARLMFIGAAPIPADVDWLRAHAVSRGVSDRVTFRGAMPMKQAWEELRAATVCVSPVPPGPLHDVSSPTKVVEYLALGMAVVANDIPDQRQLMEACRAGVCVEYSAEGFARGITQVLETPEQSNELTLRTRDRLLALRSYDVLSRQVATVMRGLTV